MTHWERVDGGITWCRHRRAHQRAEYDREGREEGVAERRGHRLTEGFSSVTVRQRNPECGNETTRVPQRNPGSLNGNPARFGCSRRVHSAPPRTASRARVRHTLIMERARAYTTHRA